LKNIFWKNDEAVIYGKRITTKRKVALYGDSDYSYSNTSKQTLPWTIELLDLRRKIEEILISGLILVYLTYIIMVMEACIAWHIDDEKSLGNNPVIASLIFGAEKKIFI